MALTTHYKPQMKRDNLYYYILTPGSHIKKRAHVVPWREKGSCSGEKDRARQAATSDILYAWNGLYRGKKLLFTG